MSKKDQPIRYGATNYEYEHTDMRVLVGGVIAGTIRYVRCRGHWRASRPTGTDSGLTFPNRLRAARWIRAGL